VPRGGPPGPARRRPGQLLLPARVAGALHRPLRGAEDQADAALGGRPAIDRHPARRHRVPGRPADPRQRQAQDLPDVRRGHRGGGRGRRRPVDLRHPEGAPPRGARRLRRTPPGPAVPRRRLDPLGRPVAPGAPPVGAGHGRAGGQVHRPPRRLPVGGRGAARRRVRPRGQGRDPLGALRRVRDARGRRPAFVRRRRDADPRRVRGAGDRRQDRRPPLRAHPRDPLARAVPRAAVHGHRVRPRRPRPGEGGLHGVRLRLPGAGDRDDGRAARVRGGRRRPRRHDAARPLPGGAGPGQRGGRGVRRDPDRGASPAPLRGQQRLPGPAGGGRHGVLRHRPGQRARRVRRAAPRGAPLLRRHPGPPRAAVAADPGTPAVRGAGGRRDRPPEGARDPHRRGRAPVDRRCLVV
ncbi:MAG: CTP synthase, partial [uncultured Nocardioidaceae bacterium]